MLGLFLRSRLSKRSAGGDQTSLTFSVSMMAFCLGTLVGGRLQKLLSATRILQIASILFLGGFVGASFITTPLGLYIAYGVCCGFGVGLAYNALLATVPSWFPDKTGFSSGLMLMGMGISSLLLGGVVQQVLNRIVWTVTFRLLGAIFFLLFFLTAPLIRRKVVPAPSSSTTPSASGSKSSATIAVISDAGGSDLTLGQTIRTLSFWILFVWAVLGNSAGLGLVSNAFMMAAEVGFAETFIPVMVGLVSAGNGVGRFLFGAFVDRFSERVSAVAVSVMMALGFVFNWYALQRSDGTSQIMTIVGFVLCGLAYGGVVTMTSVLTKRLYGETHFPDNLGAILMNLFPAAMLGPTIVARLFEQTSGYSYSHVVLAIVAALSIIPGLFLRRRSNASPTV